MRKCIGVFGALVFDNKKIFQLRLLTSTIFKIRGFPYIHLTMFCVHDLHMIKLTWLTVFFDKTCLNLYRWKYHKTIADMAERFLFLWQKQRSIDYGKSYFFVHFRHYVDSFFF